MKQITLIFTALNENNEVINTLKSLYETANHELFDVIVINDGTFKTQVSKGWYDIPKKYPCKIVHHNTRQGIHVSRSEGASLAQTKYIAFFNARMRFEAGWLDKVLAELNQDNGKTIFCTTSKVLDEKGKHATKINNGYLYGAELVFHKDQPENKTSKHFILYPSWLYEKKEGTYEIPCVLGAMYFMTKKWFNYIGGLEGLTSYGSDEEFLSLKTWVFGGKVKIISDVVISNIYRKIKSYTDNIENYLFNRLFMALVLLDETDFKKVLNYYSESEYFTLMTLRIALNFDYLSGLKAKYNKLKINNYNNYLKR